MNHLCKRSFSLIMAILMVLSLIPANPIHVRAEEASTANVAQIGDTQYESLQAAIDAADEGATITLVSDIELTEGVVVPADKTVTLDLAGKTVSMEQSETVTANHEMIHNYGNLTITDSGVDGKLSYQYTGANLGTTYAANTIATEPGSVLTVKGGTIENLTYDQATIAYAIDGRTNGGAGDVAVIIEGGKITSLRQAVRIFANSTTNTGSLEISGGDITGRVIVQNANASANKAALEITGGTFNTNAYKTDVLYVGGSNGATIDMNPVVSNGTFNGEITSTVTEGFITGGTFTNPPADDLIADGYELGTDGKVVSSTPAPVYVAEVDGVQHETLEAAFAAATEGQTIVLLTDATPALTSQRAITKAAVIDLGGKTLTLTEDDLYFGTTTFENGTIVVDPSVKPSTAVFWMFANQTLTFDAVKLVATGVTGTYLIGLDGNNADLNIINGSEILVENTTALDLDIICVNASTGNDIRVENSKVNVTNLDGRVFFRGNYTISGNSDIDLSGITKAGFRIEAGQTLTIADTATVDIAGEPRDGGIHLTDATATYTVADTATVSATINKPVTYVAKIGTQGYETFAEAWEAAQAGQTIELLAPIVVNAGESLNLNKAVTIAYTSNVEKEAMITNNGTLIVDGAHIVYTYNGAGDPSFGWGSYTIVNNATLTVESGKVEFIGNQTFGTHCSMAIFQYSGSTTINGGEIVNNAYRSARLWHGEMTITGGEFQGQVWVQAVADDSKLTINGGTFAPATSGDASSVFVTNAEHAVTFAVTGGTFTTKIGASEPENLAGAITGGTFTEAAKTGTNEALLGDMVFIKDSNGNYGVGEYVAPVAKVGNTEYATIDEAIAAWTNGTTLTLLADVTLTDVITLKSTENHTLNLGTYTMTAASGKNAIEITCEGRSSASYALTVNADATNPGGINAPGKACIYYNKTTTAKDRPIIVINNGVFNGSYSLNCISNGNTNCPQFWINGGTFNANINLTKTLLKTTGGIFNCSINCTGDQNAYRLFSGGTFQKWQFMTSGPASNGEQKLTVGNSKNNFDNGVYVDDNGYLVVGGPVITEPGTFEASSTNYGGWSSYLQYSSAKENGLYYTSVEEALADNNKTSGVVTVYANQFDMTGISYKGTIIADGLTKITNAPDGLKVVDTNGNELSIDNEGNLFIAVAQVGEEKFKTVAAALAYAKEQGMTDVEITLIGETESNTTDSFELPYTTLFNSVTFKQEDPTKTYYLYDLYTGVRTNGGKFIFDGVNITVTDQYMFEGNVELINNSKITSTAESNCFFYYADVIVNGGSSIKGVIEDIRGGTLTIDGGKTDGTYAETPSLQDAIFAVNWADSKLVLKNGAYIKINSANEVGRLTVNGTLDISDSKLESYQWIAVNQGATLTVNGNSAITTQKITGAGKIVIDATGMTAGTVAAINADVSGFTGTVTVTGNDDLKAKIVDGKVVLYVPVYVAEVNGAQYESLQAAVNVGGEITLLVDVTENITVADDATVVLDLNGKTLTGYIAPCKPTSLTVKNGSIVNTNASYSAIEINAGELVLTDVNVTSARHGVRIDGAVTATINGGEYKSISTSGTRHAVNVSGAANVTIKAGTFVGPKGTTMDSGSAVCVQAGATVTIEGGSFSKGKNSTLGVSGTMIVKGGTFDQDPSAYCANGYMVVAGDDGYRVIRGYKVSNKTELKDALSAAQDGDTIILTADIDYGTDHIEITKAITLDLGGNTLTTRARNYGLALKNDGIIVTNGKLNHAGTVAAIKLWNAAEISDLEIDVTGTSSSGNAIGGIVLQQNCTGVNTIKNVKIHSTSGQGIANGIETYNCGNATKPVIGSLENVTIDAVGTAMNISAPVGTATHCTFKGGVNGIEIWIKGTYSASLDLFNSTVEGGVYAHDEFSSDPSVVNNGTLSLTVDDATTGASAEDVTLTLARAENVEGVIKEVKDNAKAKVNDTYYATLAKAIAAAQNGDVITLLADCDEDVTVVQAPDKAITIDGASKTMTGTITVDGQSAAYATAGLTIKNVKFDATNISKDASINLGGSNSIRYTSNVTVTGCTFTGTGNTKAAIKNYTGGCKNLTVTDCTATGLHSLIQVKGVDGLKVTNVTVNGKNGIAVGTSTNVVIDNANITATGYGVRADGEGAYSMTVKNSTITANDPIVVRKNTADGYQLHVEGNTLTGNNANGYKVTFTAGDDGEYVTPDVNVKLSGTDVEDVFPAFAAKIGDLYYASLQAAYAAAEAGDEIVMLAPAVVAAGETLTLDKDVKIVYTSNVVGEDMFTVRGTLNVAAGTITYINTDTTGSNVTVSTISCEPGSVLNVTGGTIENKTVKADGSSIYSFAIDLLTNGNLGDVTVTISGGTVYSDYMAIRQFNNGTACKNSLTISGGYVYGAKRAVQVHMDNTAAYTTISGGKIEGGNYALCLFAKNNENLTVSGGEFLGDVYSATNGFITGGTFDAPVYEAYCAEGYIPTANGDGTYGVKVGQYVAQIGEKKYETLAEAFTEAQPGDEVKILVAGTYALSTSGKNITITGAVDGVVFEGMGAKNMGGASVTFNNVTFNWTNADYTGLQHCGDMKYNNCTINGQPFLYGTSEIFNNCTFNQTSSNAYNVWTYGAKNVEFNGCTFNSAGKSVLIYSEQTDLFNNVTVTNSTFKASTAVDGKAAIEMDSSSTAGIKLTIDGATTATGFGSGNVSGNSLWNNKKGNNTDDNNDITVVVNGETVLAPVTFVAQVNDGAKYESLQAAIEAAQTGDTVKLLADITLTEADCVAGASHKILVEVDGKDITLDMNGKKISAVHEDAFVSNSDCIVAVIRVNDGAGLTVTGNGIIDVKVLDENPDIYYMFWKQGTTGHLTIENGTFHMNNAADSMVYTNGNEIVTIKGGTWTLDNLDDENGPWIFNAQGQGDKHIVVTSGTFNADINRQKWSSEVLVPETCYTVKNNDGTWTVNEGAVAYVNTGMTSGGSFAPKNIGYATIEEAIEAAVAYKDENITLLANVQLTKDVEISIAGIILNTNGHTFDGNGHKITLTAADATLTAPAGLNVITNVADYKVQYVDGTYKLIAKVYVAQVNDGAKYESLAEAIDKAQAGDTITLLGNVTEDVTISKNLTIDGANFKYTGTMTVNAAVNVTVEKVNFVNGGVDKTTKSTTGTYTFKNCTFDGEGQYDYAFRFKGANKVIIEDCSVKNYQYSFLYVTSGTNSVSVKNVTVENCPSYAVYFASGVNAATFENLTVKNANNGFVINNTANRAFTIKNCTMENVGTAIDHAKGTNTITCTVLGVNDFGTAGSSEYVKYVGATIVDTNYYGDLNAMIGKAVDGQTIKLLSDIDLSKVDEMQKVDGYDTYFLVEGKDIIIDLNGKTISGEYTGSFLVGVFSTDNNGKLTLTGNGTVDVTATGKVYSLIVAYNDGSSIVIENGTYKLDKASDNLIYYGGYTDEAVTVNGGTFELGNVGTGENGKPWIFNVLGAGDHHVRITGGTFNADINRQHWSNEAVVDKTCYVVEENGTWTVKKGAVAYVATGMLTGPHFYRKDVGYATIEEAFVAADTYKDGFITLLENVALTKDVEISIESIILTAGNYKLDCGDHKIILTDVAATLTAPEGLNVVSALETHYVDYVDGTYKLALYVAQNVNTGKYYETVNDALIEAKSGETVKMLVDGEKTEAMLMIGAGVTLNLNGHTVAAGNVFSFGNIIDNNGTTDGLGGIIISNDRTKAFVQLQKGNTYMPLYDTANGCYRFYGYQLSVLTYQMSGTTAIQFRYRLRLATAEAYQLLRDTANAGVEFVVNLTVTGTDGKTTEVRYVLSGEKLAEYANAAYNQVTNDGKEAMKVTKTIGFVLSGIDTLKAGTVITANAEIVTETGMSFEKVVASEDANGYTQYTIPEM